MRPTLATALLAALAAALLLAPAARAAEPGPIRVFAAASMTEALQGAGKAYEAQYGVRVRFAFAGSPALAKQIDASAGADIFISADTEWMDYLQARGRILPATRRNLLGNRLVLIAPKSSTLALSIAPGFRLANALGAGRLAIADPATVPAGIYAKSALESLGVWRAVANRLAPGENVRVALAYVARGEAPLGVVYRTDALVEPGVRIVATFPDTSHPPIVYPAALVKGARPQAAKFLAYLATAPARALFEKAGFTVLQRAPAP